MPSKPYYKMAYFFPVDNLLLMIAVHQCSLTGSFPSVLVHVTVCPNCPSPETQLSLG